MRTTLLAALLALTSTAAVSQDVAKLTVAELDALIARAQTARKAKLRSSLPLERPNDQTAAPASIAEAGSDEALIQKKLSKTKQLYVRSDPIDAFAYLNPISLLDGKGANLRFTGDQLSKRENLAVNAFTSFVIDRVNLSQTVDFAYAPFMLAAGTLANPRQSSTERNALQSGMDLQFGIDGGDYWDLNLGTRPYFQTDFRGLAKIYGVSFLAEPYNVSQLNLGGRRTILKDEQAIISWYWRLLPELNIFHVDDPGQTAFKAYRDYSWIGGTLQFRSILFDNIGDPWLRNRFYLNGSVTQFWDASAKMRDFHDASVEFGYIISKDAPISAENVLTTSLSVIYSNGRDRLTFAKREQYQVQLNVQY